MISMDDLIKLIYSVDNICRENVNSIPTHCLCPNCNEPPIKSHSQQLKGSLSIIARSGKVIAPSRNNIDAVRRFREGKPYAGRLHAIEIKRASTFKGFCAKHDTEIFLPIERRELCIGDMDQVLAFQRRAVSFELMNKFYACAYIDASIRNLRPYIDIPSSFDSESKIQRILLRADIEYDWKPLWMERAASELYMEWRVIPKRLPVSMTSCISALPEHQVVEYTDRHIDLVAGSMDCPRPSFTLTIVPQKQDTHIIMIWNKLNAPFVEAWRQRMVSQDKAVFEEFLNECVFCKSEDYCLSPKEWDILSPNTKRILELNLPDDNHRSIAPIIPKIITI